MLANATYAYWTDSEVVLKWLRKRPDTLKIYVANRVSDILDITDVSEIRHVLSGQNSADLLTRGLHVNELVPNQLWWRGPDFLRENRTTWPEWQVTKGSKEASQAIEAECKNIVVPEPSAALTYYAPDGRHELIEKYTSFHPTPNRYSQNIFTYYRCQ